MDKAFIFTYKVQRKFKREIRKRFTPTLMVWDRLCLQRAIRGRTARALLLDYASLVDANWPDTWQEWFSNEEAVEVVKKADEARSHQFDLLGSGLRDLDDPIDWHRDIKTGYQWPADIHHLRIAWDAVPAGTDIKMPWELSRCQHFVTLALAERIKEQGCYYEVFKTQVTSWIDSNQCGFGVNWVCAMDVAIRAVNWLTAVALFEKNIETDEDELFVEALLEALWMHGRHIMRNLEWQGPKSPTLANHFLADISGVLAVGILFNESSQGKKWKKFAVQWFETEVKRQVFTDGANFETSTSYHRLSTEMFLWANMMVKQFGDSFSEVYGERLRGMGRFVDAYTSPSGSAAQFGDNDGGRFLTVGIGDSSDHRYLLSESSLGSGGQANQLLLGEGCPVSKEHKSGAFDQAGYWFGEVENGWVGVRAGEVSHSGAHAHADQLSFVLSVEGKDIIVDSGTGIYSGDVVKRNAYRSAAAHNAPRLNGCEPNQFYGGMAGLFRMSNDTKTEVVEWVVGEEKVVFLGRHHGFSRLRKKCICERKLLMQPGELFVHDRMTELIETDVLEWNFNLNPDVGVRIREGNIELVSGDVRVAIHTEPALEYSIIDMSVSPTYGVEIPSKALTMKRSISSLTGGSQKIMMTWSHR